jgi:hypothetical protein
VCTTTNIPQMRVEKCDFSGYKIYPGRGKTYVRGDSKVNTKANARGASVDEAVGKRWKKYADDGVRTIGLAACARRSFAGERMREGPRGDERDGAQKRHRDGEDGVRATLTSPALKTRLSTLHGRLRVQSSTHAPFSCSVGGATSRGDLPARSMAFHVPDLPSAATVFPFPSAQHRAPARTPRAVNS